ncbi:SRPBCC family protein [Mycobacterium sp.]|uniref:SRPBCC family protein n=1 Tax=Mycobacterium sp. TaxID=1785 RepID=UPI003F960701
MAKSEMEVSLKKWILQWGAPLSGGVTARSSAAAQDIWIALTDVTRMGEWSPECTGCTWITDAHIGVGARFRGFNRWGPLRWSTTCTIDVFSVDRCFAYSARHSSGATTRWTYDLRSDETGTTVTESFESVDSPAAVLVLDRLARRPSRLHRQINATLVRLLRHVEQQGATAGSS